jgi:flagellar motor switch/type III secretory pathway protein FliN
MNAPVSQPAVIAENLESAMDELPEEDRDAVVLRFFEGRSLREVGIELEIGEDAARMRVNRSLEKLRAIFTKLGVTGTTAGLVTMLPSGASAAVPFGLGAAIAKSVLTGTAIATTVAAATQTTSTAMNLFNLKTGVALAAAVAVTGTSTYLVKEEQLNELRNDLAIVQVAQNQSAADHEQALATIQIRDEQIARIKSDTAKLPELRGEIDRLNRELKSVEVLTAANQNLESELGRLKAQIQELLSDEKTESLDSDGDATKMISSRTYQLSLDSVLQRLEAFGLAKDQMEATDWLIRLAMAMIIPSGENREAVRIKRDGLLIVTANRESHHHIEALMGQLGIAYSPLEDTGPFTSKIIPPSK